MEWRQTYKHERKWKATDPSAPTRPYPKHDAALAEDMLTYLVSRGLDYDCAVRAGWYPAQFAGPRIIIPCLRTDGGIWWQARLMTDAPLPAIGMLTINKRWLGSSGYKHDAVCVVSSSIPGFLVVCEGPMDALAIAGYGLTAVAVLGAAPPDVVVDHVARLAAGKQVVVIPDTDRLAPWQAFQQKLGVRGVFSKIAVVPGGHKDVAAASKDERIRFLDAQTNNLPSR